MTVNQKLLSFARKQKGREASIDLLWVTGLRNSARYTIFRSRGFMARRFSNHLIDVIEVVGFGLCASPDVFFLAGSIALVGWLLTVFCEAMVHSLRSALLFGEAIPVRLLVGVSMLVAGLTYFFLYQHASRDLRFPPLAALAAAKVTIAFLNIWVSARTAEINIRRRVYFPPLLNVLFVAFSLASVVFAVNLRIPTDISIYILIATHFVVGIAGASVSLYLARRAEVMEYLLNRDSRKPLPSQDWITLSRRTLVFLSQFVQPFLLLFAGEMGRNPQVLFWAWGFKPLSLAIISRPFRSLYVDLFGAILRQEWELISMRVRHARALAAAILLVALLFVFAYAVRNEQSTVSWIFFAWILVSLGVQFFLNQSFAVAQELKLYRPVMVWRVVFPVAALFACRAFHWDFIIPLFASESILLVVMVGFFQKHDLAQGLTFDHASMRERRQPTNFVFPSEFISCFGVLAPILKRFGYDEGLYEITLRFSVRSSAKMEALLHALGKCFRSTDRVIALDSRRLLLWAPCSTAWTSIETRLFSRYPLQIEAFRKVGIEMLVPPRENGLAIPMVSQPIVQNPKALLALIEMLFTEMVGETHRGTWWTLDEKGQWASLTEVADVARSKALFALKRHYSENHILSHSRGRYIAEVNEVAVPFRPYGQVIAIFTCAAEDATIIQKFNRLREYFLAGYINYTFQNIPILPPAYWYALRSVLDALSKTKRLPIRVVELKGDERVDPKRKLRRCARTTQGSYFIDLGFEEVAAAPSAWVSDVKKAA